jgi:tetratricopeptide (TPR) repeat protein
VARLSADGDYAAVIAAVEPKLDALPAGSEATLRLALARAYGEEGRGEEAVTLLQALSTSDQTPEVQSEALVLLGATAETREDWTMAVDAYRRYLALDGAAAPYLHWRLAQDLVSAGDDAAALEELAAVDLATLSTSFQAEILEEQAAAQRRLADYDGALASYEAILAFARNTGYVALITQEAGQELLQAGRTEEATTRLAGVVSDYPDTYAAYMALRALDDLGAAEVTDLERGRILYAAGQYADAIAALEAYVAASDNPGAAALYYLALADKGAGLYDAALAAYDRLLADYGGDPLAPAAWMAKAGAVADQGGDASALYAEFAERYPDHARAPEALWRAAADLEGAGDWPRAAEFYHAVWNNYPADSRAAEALFREGLARYASGDAAGAGALWVYAQEQATGTGERARLALWLGLAAERGGNAAAAHARWHEAAACCRRAIWPARRDLLAGAAPWWRGVRRRALRRGPSDAEWQELADWVAAWWPAASSAADPLDAALVAQVRALQRLGWGDAADTPWAALRDAAHDDPAALLALARLSSELERYNTTIYCAERRAALAQVAAPAGAEARATEAAPETELSETPGAAAEAPAASATPAALERLIYPPYYGHLIAAEAEARGMDPLLFLAHGAPGEPLRGRTPSPAPEPRPGAG